MKVEGFLCPAVLSVSGTNYDSLDTVMSVDTLGTFQWTVVDVSLAQPTPPHTPHTHIFYYLLQCYQMISMTVQQQTLNKDATQCYPSTNEVTTLFAFTLVQHIAKFLE